MVSIILAVFSHASAHGEPVIFTVRSENGKPGESILVTVRMAALPQSPVGGVNVMLAFSSVFFEFEAVSAGGAFGGSSIAVSELEDSVVFVWDDASGVMKTTNELLMTVTLNIRENTASGQYPVYFSCFELYETPTGDIDDVLYDVDCGSITVTSAEIMTSSVFTVDSESIGKISTGTAANQLLDGINEKSFVKIYNGELLIEGETLVGTGMTVVLLDRQTVKQTLTVIVTGDTDGDGMTTVTDLVQTKKYLSGCNMSAAGIKAADMGGDIGVNTEDLTLMKCYLLGIKD